MRLSIVSALVVAFLATAVPARADLITFDPDDYAIGTNVSHLLPGLTVTRLVSGGANYGTHLEFEDLVVHSSIDGMPTIGSSNMLIDYETCYNRYLNDPTAACGRSWSVIELLFDGPTDFVEIGSLFLEDAPSLIAYNSAGQVVGRCMSGFGESNGCAFDFARLSTPSIPFVMTSTVTSANNDITRVVFGGTVGVSSATHIAYSVPEPATLLLVGLGAGALFIRRRRTPHAARPVLDRAR